MDLRKGHILLDLQAFSRQKNFTKHFRALKVIDFQVKFTCIIATTLPFTVSAVTGGCSHSVDICLFLITANRTLATGQSGSLLSSHYSCKHRAQRCGSILQHIHSVWLCSPLSLLRLIDVKIIPIHLSADSVYGRQIPVLCFVCEHPVTWS